MAQTLLCIESTGRPPQATLTLGDDLEFSVWALLDEGASERGLRVTALRRADELPPANAVLVLHLRVVTGAAGSSMRVLKVGPQIQEVIYVQPDVESRVGLTTTLRNGCSLRLHLHPSNRAYGGRGSGEGAWGQAVRFTLQYQASAVDTRTAVSSSGAGRSQALVAASTALWLVPAAWTLVTDWTGTLIDNFVAWVRRYGISPRTAIYISTMAFVFGGAAWAWYIQYKARNAAEEKVARTEDALEQAQAAQQAALQSEMACFAERKAIAKKLKDKEEQLSSQVDGALGVTASRTVALEGGGKRLGSEDALAWDTSVQPGLRKLVAQMMTGVSVTPQDMVRCQDQSAALGSDLPLYALAWSTDPEKSCLENLSRVDGSAHLVGYWGLSERTAREFGAPDPAYTYATPEGGPKALEADPRVNVRWASAAMSAGLREVQDAVLKHDSGSRVPVAPSQAQLWSLALFGAYNLLPQPPVGLPDADLCISQVMDDLLSGATAPAPGEPLLPDIVQVATGDRVVLLRPTPPCDWPPDALEKGVQYALTAVARQAALSTPE